MDVTASLAKMAHDPWVWVHAAAAVGVVGLYRQQSWMLPRRVARFWLVLALLTSAVAVVLLAFPTPLVWGPAVSVFAAVLLRFQGDYDRRRHPGPLYLGLNLVFATATAAMLLDSWLPPLPSPVLESLPLVANLGWPTFSVLAPLALSLRLSGWRARSGRHAGFFLATGWLPALIVHGLAFLVDRRWLPPGWIPTALVGTLSPLLLLPVGSAISLWADLIAEQTRRRLGRAEEHHWSLQALSHLIEALSYQMQQGVTFRQSFLTGSVERMSRLLGAAGAGLFLVDSYRDVLRAEVLHGSFPPLVHLDSFEGLNASQRMSRFLNAEIPLTHSLLEATVRELRVTYYPSLAQTEELEHSPAATEWEDLALLVAPLHYAGRLIGIFALSFLRAENRVLPRTMKRLKDVAFWMGQLVYTLLRFENEQDRLKIDIQANQVREIQSLLLPKRLPNLQSVTLAAFSRAARGVSGDYYDVIPLRRGEFLLVIGDVAGKGLPASMTMVMIRTILYLLAHQKGMGPARLLDLINWGLAGKINLDRYTTMAIAHYDLRTRQLTYSNAAHRPLLVLRSDRRTFESLDTEGIPIGLEKSSKYRETHTRLEKNDIIVLYTDGIIEAMNEKGEFYGLERLEHFLLSNHRLTADKMKRALEQELDGFSGNAVRQDDQTILLMRVERE